VGLGGYGGLCLRNMRRRNLDLLGCVRSIGGIAGNVICGVMGGICCWCMIAFVDNGYIEDVVGRIDGDNTNSHNDTEQITESTSNTALTFEMVADGFLPQRLSGSPSEASRESARSRYICTCTNQQAISFRSSSPSLICHHHPPSLHLPFLRVVIHCLRQSDVVIKS
jgi:hypothetical protein